jgi:hypothetical protein
MSFQGPKPGARGAWLASSAAITALLLLSGCSDGGSAAPVDAGAAGNGAGAAGGSAGAGGSGACVGAPGHELWSQRFGDDDPTDDDAEHGNALATDGAGNIVLAGYFSGTLDLGAGPFTSTHQLYPQAFWASFTPDGAPRWEQTELALPPTYASAFAYSVPLHVSLNDASGALLSIFYMGAVDFGPGPMLGTAVPVVDANDNVLPEYAGCCLIEYATALVKLDPDGQALWSKRIGQSEVACVPACDASPGVITFAAANSTLDGDILVSGVFQGTIDLGCGPLVAAFPPNADGPFDGFVAKLDQAGNCLWAHALGGDIFSIEATPDDAGNILLVGGFQGTLDVGGTTLTSQGGYDVLVAKLDSDGTLLWAKSFGSAGDDDASSSRGSRAVDGSITLAVHSATGQAIDFGAGPVGAGAAFVVVRLDADGALGWTHEATTSGELRFGTRLDVAPTGEVLLAGQFEGNVDLGAGPLEATSPEEFFVGKLAADGSLLWSERFGGALDDGAGNPHAACWSGGCNWVRDLRLDPAGSAVLTGTFRGSLDFGSGPLVSQGIGDGYLAKLCR